MVYTHWMRHGEFVEGSDKRIQLKARANTHGGRLYRRLSVHSR